MNRICIIGLFFSGVLGITGCAYEGRDGGYYTGPYSYSDPFYYSDRRHLGFHDEPFKHRAVHPDFHAEHRAIHEGHREFHERHPDFQRNPKLEAKHRAIHEGHREFHEKHSH